MGVGRPVDLVKIDYVDGKAAKAILDFAADRVGDQYFLYLTVGIPAQATLGKDVWSGAAPAFQRPADYFLGVPQTVDCGRVDPVDAEFERTMNSGDRFVVVLRTPGELPARAADGPGPVAHSSNVQVRIAKFARFHLILLSKFRAMVRQKEHLAFCRTSENAYPFAEPGGKAL